MKHPSERALNDFIDELLPETERLEVRSHLDECADCRRTTDELQQLAAAAAELGEIEPTRDLLPAIRKAAVTRSGYGWVRWAAAAAVLGFAALLMITRLGGGVASPASPTAERGASLKTLLADFHYAEAEYIKATEMLARGLDQRRDEIAPETLAVLDKNLALIDSAIVEVRHALDRDGVDVENTHLLTALYDKKLDVLLQASRLSS